MKRKLPLAVAIALPIILFMMLRQAASWRPRAFGQGEPGALLTVSPDGSRLLADGHLIDLTREKGVALNKNRTSGNFSTNGQAFICLDITTRMTSADPTTIKMAYIEKRRSKDGRILQRMRGKNLEQVGYSTDGQSVLAFDSKEVSAYRLRDGQMTKHYVWPVLADNIQSTVITLSPDGSRFLTATFGSDVSLFDAATGRLLKKMPSAPDFVLDMAISPDNRLGLLTTADESMSNNAGLIVRDLLTGKELWRSTRQNSTAFSPDSQQVALISVDSVVCDAHTGKVLRHLPRFGKNGLSQVVWTPDGQYLIVSDHEGTLYKLRLH